MSKWIPVSERLPIAMQKVRVLYEDGGEEDNVYWETETRCCMLGSRAGSFPDGFTSSEAGGLPVEDVTHWMPLPDPPTPNE